MKKFKKTSIVKMSINIYIVFNTGKTKIKLFTTKQM